MERVPWLDADVVLECKQKDRALLALREALGLTADASAQEGAGLTTA